MNVKLKYFSQLCLLILFCTQEISFAQTGSTKAFEAFAKYKIQAQSLGQSPDYIFAASAQRLDDTSVRLNFVFWGKMSGFDIEIQPLTITNDGQYDAGEANKLSGNAAASNVSAAVLLEPSSVISTSFGANAVSIKWFARGGGLASANTMIVPISNDPSGDVMGISLPKEKVGRNSRGGGQ